MPLKVALKNKLSEDVNIRLFIILAFWQFSAEV